MKPQWEIEQLPIVDRGPEELSALRIECRFPLSDEERMGLIDLLSGCQHWMERQQSKLMRREILIQMTQLPRPGGATLLSRNSSKWIPSLAMGVWPDREPPRSMTKRDFTHRLPGQKFPTLSHEVRRILAKDEDARLDVEEQMADSGALLEIIASEGWAERDARQISTWLKGKIDDDVYRSYPFYVPLLDAETLIRLSKDERDACLAGIYLYLREDPDDESIFLVARASFEKALEMIDSCMKATATR
ncbi:hypothetical protein AB4Y89_07860 [Terriglobus sp. 2YAB30_2]|uniref:hypothetical protein n=1 Tax=unclassified Terriglobus TaxID=2628988 RepID=UPI003F9481D2